MFVLKANGFAFSLPVKVGPDFDVILAAWELSNDIGQFFSLLQW